ncbi:MAG: hypothetical protein M5U17_17380 [Ignavibacterium sp.]|nr:hypothetical protein [Ignavibacterium sp.]
MPTAEPEFTLDVSALHISMVEGKALALFEKINLYRICKLAKTKIFNNGTIILYYEPITTKTMSNLQCSTYKKNDN